jgi:hypothetical protein
VEAAVDERALRRARRFIWAFRLIFYPGAILAAVLLLSGLGRAHGPAFLTGITDQGGSVTVRLDDGEPTRLFMDLSVQCPARDWWFMWSRAGLPMRDGAMTFTDVAEHRYHYHQQTSRRTVKVDARLDDGRLWGSVTAAEHFDGPYWGAYDCFSDAVSFSAG